MRLIKIRLFNKMESLLHFLSIDELNSISKKILPCVDLTKLDKETLQTIYDPSKLDKKNLQYICDFTKLSKEELFKICNPLELCDATLRRVCDPSMLDNIMLKKVCDLSKLPLKKFPTLLTDEIAIAIVRIFQNLNLSLEDLESIEFEKFSECVHQKYLMLMLRKNMSMDELCVVLDKMQSVNFGDRIGTNPLIYCCMEGQFDLVKLLVEKYSADIEYLSSNNTTPIMFSAQNNHQEITKYLYDKGAKLTTELKNVYEFATSDMIELFRKWEIEKTSQNKNNEVEKQSDYDKMRADYEKLQEEFKNMKESYEKMLGIIYTVSKTN